MAKEIERKFCVSNDSYKAVATESFEIAQAYLSRTPEATVRVRIKNGKAFLTVKSITQGCSRDEWEYEIPVEDAREMISVCAGKPLIKTRYIVPAGAYKWEIDEFHGALEGLVIAEIELVDENASFDKPDFIGREVTGDPRYYNSNLIAEAQA